MLRKFFAIIEDTVREGLARKTILGMFIVSTLAIIIAALLFQMDSVQHGLLSPGQGHIQMGRSQPATAMLGLTVLDMVWMTISMLLLLTAVFVGTFVTAGFITSMMEKGTIDLLLSKPVPRWLYVVGRYSGAVLIVLVEIAYLVLGLWLVAGISLGSWGTAFLSSIVFITLTFAGVFALVTLIGILTRSSWFALIIGLALYILAGVVVPIGQFFDRLLNGGNGGGFLTAVASALHYSIPSEGMGLTLTSVLTGSTVNITPIFLTAGLTIVYVGLSCFAFSKKEF
jgi:ABC-type transport system involved in multi-copper enzyme maturation permease subunit